MKVKRILMSCILVFGLAGITTNYTSHATSNAIKYENEGNGTYVPVYNDGKGAAGGLGMGPKPLNKSQAKQYNATHDPDEESKGTYNNDHQSYTSNSNQNVKHSNLTPHNNEPKQNNKSNINKKVHKYNHSKGLKKNPTKSTSKTNAVKNTRHHNKKHYTFYAVVAIIVIACLGILYGIIRKLTNRNKRY